MNHTRFSISVIVVTFCNPINSISKNLIASLWLSAATLPILNEIHKNNAKETCTYCNPVLRNKELYKDLDPDEVGWSALATWNTDKCFNHQERPLRAAFYSACCLSVAAAIFIKNRSMLNQAVYLNSKKHARPKKGIKRSS